MVFKCSYASSPSQEAPKTWLLFTGSKVLCEQDRGMHEMCFCQMFGLIDRVGARGRWAIALTIKRMAFLHSPLGSEASYHLPSFKSSY